MLKSAPEKGQAKYQRLYKVLLALVEHYIATGKPVGSQALQESGLEDISSATIRNYFAQLEEEGFLSQQHVSGGRIPTYKAYKTYAEEYQSNITPLSEELKNELHVLCTNEQSEVNLFLQRAAEWLSRASGCAAFIAAPRFDQDFILDMKIVDIDSSRCLVIIVTDFGVVQTEIVHVDRKPSSFSIKRIEHYFRWRLLGQEKPENMLLEEEMLAQRIYNEVLVRYLVNYSNFIEEDLYRTGFSHLLNYPELRDAATLSQSLSLFENRHAMRLLLKECQKNHKLKYWIGQDLTTYSVANPECAVVAIPYYINQTVVGAVGILGPMRLHYRELFSLMTHFSASISEVLTKLLYKYKIDFRRPADTTYYIKGPAYQNILLEDKTLKEAHD